ncbi:MAG: DinB family protein [Calditrichaeota bacterium]|nr:MAG: DinB family protein [Calditrichota bacterium]
MFDRDILLKPYRFNLYYAQDLVADLADAKLYETPAPGLENHPGWTLGHLATGSAMIAEDLGEASPLPDSWVEMFQRRGPGDPRLPDCVGDDLPTKAELLAELEAKHQQVERLIQTVDDAKFAERCEWRFERFFPTTYDMVLFMCVTHEAMHLAQVAAWRRAFKLPSSLGRIR